MTRGVLIAPGETFSANGFVGKRTKEKGFASAPVIENGKFSEDYGGGVSQWATTTFNAAFFAGLDIPDHKAHSIYISRYPYGREATLAYPSVDLKIHNNTPYGVVMAGALISALPLLIVFFFVQKRFVEGIAMTGMK